MAICLWIVIPGDHERIRIVPGLRSTPTPKAGVGCPSTASRHRRPTPAGDRRSPPVRGVYAGTIKVILIHRKRSSPALACHMFPKGEALSWERVGAARVREKVGKGFPHPWQAVPMTGMHVIASFLCAAICFYRHGKCLF